MQRRSQVSAVDLFCGAGGLSLGLKQAGINVTAGIDLDPACRYPFEQNVKAKFILRDVGEVTADEVLNLWPKQGARLLAGCAPCQPFSSHRRGADTRDEGSWDLLSHFSRLVETTMPEYVTMENVPRLVSKTVFSDFVSNLKKWNYSVDYGTLYGPHFGLPQERRRLVLVASRVGSISVPDGYRRNYKTVRQTIAQLPPLKHGEAAQNDPLHVARSLTPINLERMRHSKPGGTWEDWPEEIRAACHQRASGKSFRSFYGRMEWDSPSPTITTQSFNFGTGRFGHPEQDRSITLREAAMLQGFPSDYKFVPDDGAITMKNIGRLIGNAVPPNFGRAVGRVIRESANRSI